MTDLSLTQEYYLCAVNAKGRIPFGQSEVAPVGLLASAVLELLARGLIARDDQDKLTISQPDTTDYTQPLDQPIPAVAGGLVVEDSLSYLRPLYDTVASFGKPKTLKGLVDHYVLGLSNKPFNALLAAIGQSLWSAECADLVPTNNPAKQRYAPRRDATTRVIEKIRAEFLEPGPMDDDTICLAALLNTGGLIRSYFSKFEATALKARLKEVRRSELPASFQEMLDYFDQVIATMVVLAAAGAA